MSNNNDNDTNGSNGSSGKNGKNGGTSLIAFFIVAGMCLLFFSIISNTMTKSQTKEIGYNEFMNLLDDGKIKSVEITDSQINIFLKSNPSKIKYYTGFIYDDNLVQKLQTAEVNYKKVIPNAMSKDIKDFAFFIIMILVIFVFTSFLFKRLTNGTKGIMNVGKSNAKVYMEKKTGKTFKDVAGQEEAKESVTEIVDFLHNPTKYTKIGAKLPKGALLVGPPGTGKTLLAKAVAGEANVPFFSLSGSDFVEMYVGVGASRVRDLFKQAQEAAPCIIFIDEIDAIGKSRDSRNSSNDEREQTLNQLLSEMDGFDSSKGVVILAATNRPEILDKALLRPGRFDRRIIVDKPDLKGRTNVLKVHAKNVLMDETVDLEKIALATSGAVGSDLANMINEAAINAVKHGREFVTQADLFESVELVIAGKEKKDRIMNAEEKRIVAYHEIGHALTTALNKNTEPVQKITIIPRTMGSLGYVLNVPEEEKYLMKKEEIYARITTLLGGRAAERIVFNSETTGASNDIEKATSLARSIVTQYGMSDKFGPIGLETVEDQYLNGRVVLNCSDKTAADVDTEVMNIIKHCYEIAEKGLQENLDALHALAEFLIEKETITGQEFMNIFKKIKGITPDEPNSDILDTENTPVAEFGTEITSNESSTNETSLDTPHDELNITTHVNQNTQNNNSI